MMLLILLHVTVSTLEEFCLQFWSELSVLLYTDVLVIIIIFVYLWSDRTHAITWTGIKIGSRVYIQHNVMSSLASYTAIICHYPYKCLLSGPHYQSQLTVSYRRTLHLLLELLFVQFGYLSVSCLSQADITYAIDSICTSWCVICYLLY